MILRSIRLHPFGKFNDMVHEFGTGVHILNGPNEYGKSTISNAIRHALYTTTKLTPAKLEKEVGNWFPHPHGSSCAVTLVIEHEGLTWTISKQWSKTGSSNLSCSDGLHLHAIDAEEKIAEIIGFNQATWNHVFHTSQAALVETVSELSKNATQLDDVIASTSVSATHDISPERFLDLIDKRIDDQYRRWIADLDLPEGGRGIDRPWENRKGVIYEAYIDWKREERLLQELEAYDTLIDRKQREQAVYKATIETLDTVVADGQSRRNQLLERVRHERDIASMASDLEEKQSAYKEWPLAKHKIEAAQKQLVLLQERRAKLTAEYTDAERQSSADKLRKTYATICEAQQHLQNAENILQQTTRIEQEVIDRAREIDRALQAIEIKIGAHKLAASITATKDVDVTLRIGSTEQHVRIGQDHTWSNTEVPGEFVIAYEGVTVTVSSAAENMQALVQSQHERSQQLQQLLAGAGADSIETLVAMHRQFIERMQQRDEKRRSYQQYLEGKTFEEWETSFQALKEMPSTRSLTAINEEMLGTDAQIAEHTREIQKSTELINRYEALYTDEQQLFIIVANLTTKHLASLEALRSLPELPAGYDSADEFISDVERQSAELNIAKQQLARVEAELRSVVEPPSQLSLTDLADKVDLKHSAYRRAIDEGKALKRIRTVVERTAEHQLASGPLQELPSTISSYFERLTNGAYTRVEVDDKSPTRASGATLTNFDVARLSQGTKTSLALATRLALANVYLGERPGVIMLDDPCVDMDADRASAAMALLKDVGAQHQVIVFTCHS
jgi:uncharacterized protein YhaN